MRTPHRNLPALVLAALVAASFAFPASRSGTQQIRDDTLTVTGTVAGYSVAADGTVSIQIDPVDADEPLRWFETPADRTATTRFEDLALDVVLAAEGAEGRAAEITVRADRDTDKDGASLEEAFSIRSIAKAVGGR